MTAACRFEGCTVGETGRCALEQDINSCSNRVASIPISVHETSGEVDVDQDGVAPIGSSVLNSPNEAPRFPPSVTLGIEAIRTMMANRYVTIVGILGDPESGKTAALASLYLLVSNAKLKGWSFADSRSLMGFEEIVRGARQWNSGNPPQQMTVHTEMTDERRPGFLHIRLKRESDNKSVDLALPDIPGEWTKDLVRVSRTDRFQFMKAADVIWIVLDGRSLIDRTQRQGAITRLGQLAGRLKALMEGAEVPRLLLVLTHQDAGAIPSEVIGRLNAEVAKHDLLVKIIPIASFSDSEQVKAGSGLSDLIDATVNGGAETSKMWPSSDASSVRNYLNYRSN